MYKLTLKFNLKNNKTTILHCHLKNMTRVILEVEYVTACMNTYRLIWICGTIINPDIVKSFEWEYEANMFDKVNT